MISFLLTRQSDPAAMPIAEPTDDDPWILTWNEGIRRWSLQLLDATADTGDDRDGLDSLLAFVAYLGCPIRIVGGGRGAPTIEILDQSIPGSVSL